MISFKFTDKFIRVTVVSSLVIANEARGASVAIQNILRFLFDMHRVSFSGSPRSLWSLVMTRPLFSAIPLNGHFIRFLSFKAFAFLVILLCINQVFASQLDISDIEQTLSNEQDNIRKPKIPTAKDEVIKPVNQITGNTIGLQSNPLPANSVGENTINKNPEPLPQADKAKLIILNKITTKSSEHILKVGKKQLLGNLFIEVHKCVKATDPYNSNNWMLLTIFDNKIEGANQAVFHGWVLSSNQSLSMLEHPVYEVIPRDCIISDK
jgi:hypothetical protein